MIALIFLRKFTHQFWKVCLDLRCLSGERPAMVSATYVDYRTSDLINHKVIWLIKVQQLQWEEPRHKSQVWVRQAKGWILCLHSYLFPPQIITQTFRRVLLSSQCRRTFFLKVKKSSFLLSSTLIGPSARHLKKATRKPFSSAAPYGEEKPPCLHHEDSEIFPKSYLDSWQLLCSVLGDIYPSA